MLIMFCSIPQLGHVEHLTGHSEIGNYICIYDLDTDQICIGIFVKASKYSINIFLLVSWSRPKGANIIGQQNFHFS